MTSPFDSMAVSPVAPTGKVAIDALLDAAKWGGSVGRGATVGYSFAAVDAVWYADSGGRYSSYDEPGYVVAALSTTMQNAARRALTQWSSVADLTFHEIGETTGAVGDIRFALVDHPDMAGWWGWTYSPYAMWAPGGDVWLNQRSLSGNWWAGSYDFMALVHEIGHALGLKHPFAGDAVLPSAYDSTRYSVMSYTEHPAYLLGYDDNGTAQYAMPSTPMLYDIAAIQHLYGANRSYRSGNDTYTFRSSTPFVMTLWDAGGTDTLFAGNFSAACTIDLNPGHFSSLRIDAGAGLGGYDSRGERVYDGSGNLAIAWGAYIENAVGGSGADRLIGNAQGNSLNGGQGNDTLSGGGGDDTLLGGAGNDSLAGGDGVDSASYANALAAVAANLGVGVRQATGGGGSDVLNGIENLLGSNYADRLTGNAGANSLNGGSGADTLVGGGGNDLYWLDSNADRVVESAGGGNDTVFFTMFNYFLPENIENGRILYGGMTLLMGNASNNLLYSGSGDSVLIGAGGADTTSYRYAAGGVQADLRISTWQDTGASGSDMLVAIANLDGSAYGDHLIGNAGNNVLNGGAGRDTMTGGAGNDIFHFAQAAGTASFDRITDFNPAVDRIRLDDFSYAALSGQTRLSTSQFSSGTSGRAGDASDRIVYETDTGNLYYDPDGLGGVTTALVAVIAGRPTLSADDFLVV